MSRATAADLSPQSAIARAEAWELLARMQGRIDDTAYAIDTGAAEGPLLERLRAEGSKPESLGRQLAACKTAWDVDPHARLPRLRHLMATEEDKMPRNSNTPERDDRGRFISDDDRGGSRGRSSGRYDDDERRYSRSRRDDDDSDRGQGWHGDRRGHSEASPGMGAPGRL